MDIYKIDYLIRCIEVCLEVIETQNREDGLANVGEYFGLRHILSQGLPDNMPGEFIQNLTGLLRMLDESFQRRKDFIFLRNNFAPSLKSGKQALEKYRDFLKSRPDKWTEKLDFLQDSHVKTILSRQLTELFDILIPINANESITILGGSITEALLLYTLQLLQQKKTEEFKAYCEEKKLPTDLVAHRWSLAPYIEANRHFGIITQDEFSILDTIRGFRNLIHPARQIRTEDTPSSGKARILEGILLELLEKLPGRLK